MTQRQPLIAGNWKMYKTRAEATALVSALLPLVENNPYTRIALCPPLSALGEVARLIDGSNIALGAQNCHFEDQGAFTGEISPRMLKDAGCEFVIVGHSERRQYFGETDESIHKKIIALYRNDLKPIVCVGETIDQRKANNTAEVVTGQIRACLNELPPEKMQETVIAYEPVWAIGTGLTATPIQAQEVHNLIRGLLKEMFGEKIAVSIRIQYGGSVKPNNVKELMAQQDIDGALVGGASLEADSFATIVNFKD